MEFEEKYEDLLQNIEAVIVAMHREQGLSDLEVKLVAETLAAHYRRLSGGVPLRPLGLNGKREVLAQRLQARLEERQAMIAEGMPLTEAADADINDVYMRAFKRIVKSVERWSKPGNGGYLRFVGRFV